MPQKSEPLTTNRTKKILQILRVLCWATFFSFLIEAGYLIISLFSDLDKESARRMFNGYDLTELRHYSLAHFTGVVYCLIAILLLKALIVLRAARGLFDVDARAPFTISVARTLSSVSFLFLLISIISFLHNAHAVWLVKHAGVEVERIALKEYIFMTGLVYVITQVFKRAVELQSENELTV